MKVNPVGSTNFQKITETFRKGKEEDKKPVVKEKDKEKEDVYEATVTYTETIKVPKDAETLHQLNYLI